MHIIKGSRPLNIMRFD